MPKAGKKRTRTTRSDVHASSLFFSTPLFLAFHQNNNDITIKEAWREVFRHFCMLSWEYLDLSKNSQKISLLDLISRVFLAYCGIRLLLHYFSIFTVIVRLKKVGKIIIISDMCNSAVAACDSILYKEALKTIAPSLTQKLSEATKTSARRWSFTDHWPSINLTSIQVCSRVSQHCSRQPQPSRWPSQGAQT